MHPWVVRSNPPSPVAQIEATHSTVPVLCRWVGTCAICPQNTPDTRKYHRHTHSAFMAHPSPQPCTTGCGWVLDLGARLGL